MLDNCPDEMAFFNQFIDKGLIERLELVANSEFGRISYTEAIEILKKNNKKFQFPVEWGVDIQTEHERYLTEVVFKKPVFVTDYPDRAEHAAENPVAMIQHGDPEAHIACINALGRLDRAQQGIGLIGQREDHVPLAAAHLMKSLQKGQTVEDMPAVEQQRHHRNGNKRDALAARSDTSRYCPEPA